MEKEREGEETKRIEERKGGRERGKERERQRQRDRQTEAETEKIGRASCRERVSAPV